MDNYTWTNCTIGDVSNNGANYMYSLLCDYERYIKDFGYITVQEFLPLWTCITYKSFAKLQVGDSVYLPGGIELIVMDDPFESDDETSLYVEVVQVKEDGTFDDTGNSNEVLNTGDLYSSPVPHKDYLWRKIKKESEELLCPILITKTNQPQN